MSALAFIGREAWNEFAASLRNGVAALIFVILTAYILLFLTNDAYLRDISASDVPRNAPSLVYMFSSGNSFFLLFAWAWLFAQPIVRDRAAKLHEIVLAAPVSLRQLLFARFLGVFGVAALMGASQTAGFLLAPYVLEPLGLVPAGSMAETPWAALGWGWLVFAVPNALGAGAIYFTAALATRNTAGPFTAGAILILLWMFAIVLMGEGDINPALATIVDLSGFTDADRTVHAWTPIEKATALYPLTGPFLINRALWGGVPVIALAWAIWRVTREHLVIEQEPKRRPLKPARARLAVAGTTLFNPIRATSVLRTVGAETAWQLGRVLRSRALWFGAGGLALLGLAGAFYHVIFHADGPFEARAENAIPILSNLMYLFISFAAAALAGHVMRRDDREGFQEMFDAAPAPVEVRLIGRCVAVVIVTLMLALLPGVSTVLATLFYLPQFTDLATPLLHQSIVVAPALLELVGIAVLVHALVRPSGPAYAISIFIAFIAIVGNEVRMFSYPPAQPVIPVHMALSKLTGWALSAERLAYMGTLKFVTVLLLMTLAGILLARGPESRLIRGGQQLRARLFGPLGATAVALVLAGAALHTVIHTRYVEEGGYQTETAERLATAAWEKRWLGSANPFVVAGGDVQVVVNAGSRRAQASWLLRDVRASGALHAELPEGFTLERANVNGRDVEPDIFEGHIAIPLDGCGEGACDIDLAWTVEVAGWDVDGEEPWVSNRGVWLTSGRVMPRLGFDIDRVIRAPADRETRGLSREFRLPVRAARAPLAGAAPAGDWHWRLRIADQPDVVGHTSGPLRFAAVWSPRSSISTSHEMTLLSDKSRIGIADGVAQDAVAMRQCVARRLGTAPHLRRIVQLPREMGTQHCEYGQTCEADGGASEMAGDLLFLAEQPHWDIARAGIGRWQRQAAIARMLVAQTAVDIADLRQGDGAQWLVAGLGGAIGLLCVGDENGLDALQALLERGADLTAQALASSVSPVGPLSEATARGWTSQYAPLASLSWAATASPDSIRELLRLARESGDLRQAFGVAAGTQVAAGILGLPQSSDVAFARGVLDPAVSRWRWVSGGWRLMPDDQVQLLALTQQSELLTVRVMNRPAPVDQTMQAAFVIDDWASYERAPSDNWMQPASD